MYFFIEFCEGTPWSPYCSPLEKGKVSIGQATRFAESYADEQIKIHNLPFRGIGSLYPGKTIGPLISGVYFGKPQPPYFFGPFKTNRDRYITHIKFNLDLIANHNSLSDNL